MKSEKIKKYKYEKIDSAKSGITNRDDLELDWFRYLTTYDSSGNPIHGKNGGKKE